ncbi:MAG: DUF3301 domain-containing protein [Gammaproteobacteria bacterium]|nr:MAG: DUF3301 domain-containing protein [Gammaproteobacteria bacterium]
MTWEIWVSAALFAAAWLWWDSLKKRELAILAARRVCQRAGVQFLDDTVSLARMRLRRDDNQRAAIYREFAFEFSDNGDNRLPGRVYLLGDRVLDVNLILPARGDETPPPDNVIHFPPR